MAILCLDLTTSLLLGLLIIALVFLMFHRHNPKYPPCPIRPWPIVGHLLQLEENPREQFVRFRQKCGDIFSLYMGTTHVIILNGHEVAREAFVKRGDEFSDRAVIFMDVALDTINKGVGSGNGEVWRENRTLMLNILRNFGLGKNILVERVHDELQHYLELFESFKGEATDVRLHTMVSVSNLMCSLIVGKRFEYDNAEFMRMVELLNYNFTQVRGTALVNYFPWLQYLPGDLFKFKIITKNFKEFLNIFAHKYFKANEKLVGEPDNFIAAYMQEIEKRENSGLKTNIDRPNLKRNVFDLFAGGTETTSNTILWIMLYMLNYPEMQEKVFKEVESMIGLERRPSMQDKTQMVYTQAAILEVQRQVNIVPLGLPRVVLRKAEFRGYTFPKGAQIMLNIDSLLQDKAVWGEDALEYRPERFISKDGSLLTPDELTPFLFGRRSCPGEGLARMEIFLFITSVIQKFRLEPEDTNNIPPIREQFGITRTPAPYKIRFISRGY